MATITINIPVDKEAWVLNGFAFRFGYPTTVPNPDYNSLEFIINPDYDDQIPEDPTTNPTMIDNPFYDPALEITNPQSLPAFVKEHIIEFIKYEAGNGYVQEEGRTREAESNLVTLT